MSDELSDLKKWGRLDYPDAIIDDDCPVFVIKFKDMHAKKMLFRYAALCDNAYQKEMGAAVDERIKFMLKWQEENRDRIKEPDLPGMPSAAPIHPEKKNSEKA